MSPRTAEQNQTMRGESQARIIDAALRLFGTHGYEATSVRMIAQEAGVAQGLMYSHFASKDALLVAIFERSMQDVRESFRLAEEREDPDGPVAALIRAAFAVLRERSDFWRLSYGVRMQPTILRALGDELFAWTTTVTRTLEHYCAAAGWPDPAVDAEILFATIDGISQHYLLDPERYPLDAVIERLVERYRRE
jgi:AcrR family transcriptional regulator